MYTHTHTHTVTHTHPHTLSHTTANRWPHWPSLPVGSGAVCDLGHGSCRFSLYSPWHNHSCSLQTLC